MPQADDGSAVMFAAKATGAPPHLPGLTCRKCGAENPIIYLAPVALDGRGTCICIPCARARGWLDRDDNLRPGVTL